MLVVVVQFCKALPQVGADPQGGGMVSDLSRNGKVSSIINRRCWNSPNSSRSIRFSCCNASAH